MKSKDQEELESLQEDLKSAADNSEEKCNVLFDIAELFRKNDKFEEALSSYEEALKICKANKDSRFRIPEVYSGVGECHLALSNPTKAEENIITALLEMSILEKKDTTRAVKLLYTLGKVYRLDNRVNASKKMITIALPITENINKGLVTHHIIDILNEMAVTLYSQQQLKLSNRIFMGIIEARKKRFGGQDFTASRFMTSYGEMLRSQGRDKEALGWYQDALSIRKAIDVLESTKDSRLAIADSYSNLGLVYRAQGNFDEAESYLMNALDIRREELNGRGAVIGSTLNNIAELYRDRGQFGQALMFHETCINAFKACLAPDHPNVINARGNLGVTLRHQARTGNLTGDDLIKNSVKFFKEKNYGDDHPWVRKFKLEMYYSKANELSEDGDYDKAIELYKILIESKRFSDESRITKMLLKELWITQCKKAVFLRDQGRYDEAKSLFRACMDEAERHCASTDSEMCEYTFAQAENLRQMGLTDDAIELYNVLMKIRVEQFGESHPLIARLKNALAICEMEKGNYLESKALFKQALEIINVAIENDHETYFVEKFNYTVKSHILSDFSELNRRMSSYFKAKDKQDQALELKIKYYGLHTNEVADSYHSYAKILYSIGRLESAATYNNKAYDIWTHIFDDSNHPKIGSSFLLSAQLDIENGNCTRARASIERATQIYNMIYPPEYPAVVYSIYITGKVLLASGMHRQAEKCFQRAHAISIKAIGQYSTLAALCSYENGELQSELGNYDEAGIHFRDALLIQEHALGKYHPDYFQTLIGRANNQRRNCRYSDAAVLFEDTEKLLTLRDTAYASSESRSPNVELNSKENLPIYAIFLLGEAQLAMDNTEYKKAGELLERALEMRVKMYGEHHQYVHAVKHQQYEVMRAHGKNIDELKELYTENILGMARHWSNDHVCVAKMNVDKADFRINYNQSNVKTRATLLECSYIAIRCHGKGSVLYGNIMVSLGQMMVQEELYCEAKQYFDEARDVYEKTVGKTHRLYGILLNNYSELARFQREDSVAESYNKQAMDVMVECMGEEHPLTMNVDGNAGLIAMRADATREDGIQKVREIHSFLVTEAGYGEEHPWVVKFQEAIDAADVDNISVSESTVSEHIKGSDSVERMVIDMEESLDVKTAEIEKLQLMVDEKDALLAAAMKMETIFTQREIENTTEIENLRKQLDAFQDKDIDKRKEERNLELELEKTTRDHKILVRTNTANFDKMSEMERAISDLEEKNIFLENKLAIQAAEVVEKDSTAPSVTFPPAADDERLQLTITLAFNLKQELDKVRAELGSVNESLMSKMEENDNLTRKLQDSAAESDDDNKSVDTVGSAGEELMLLKEENSRLKRKMEELKNSAAADDAMASKEEVVRLKRKLAKDSTEDDGQVDLLTVLALKLKQDLDTSTSEIAELRKQLNDQQSSNPSTSSDDGGQADLLTLLALKLKQDLDSSTSEIERLQNQLRDQSCPSVSEDAGQVELLTSLSLKLKQDLDAATADIEELRNQAKKQPPSASFERVCAPATATDGDEQIELLTALSLKLKQDLDAAMADVENLQKKNHLSSSAADSDKLAKQVEDLQFEVTAGKEEIEKLQRAQADADAKHLSEMEDMESAYATLQANLAMLEGDDTSNKLQTALAEANKKVKAMTTENADLLRELKIGKANIVDAHSTSELLRADIEAIKVEYADLLQEKNELEQDKFMTQQYIQKSDEKVDELNAALAECCKAREGLEKEIADDKKQREDVEQSMSKFQSDAEASLGELKAEVDRLLRELSVSTTAKDAVQAELEQCKASHAKAQHEAVKVNKANEESIKDLNEKLKAVNVKLDAANVKMSKLNEENENFLRKRANFESLIAHLKAENGTKQDEITKHIQTIHDLEAQLKTKSAEVETVLKESQDVREEVQEKRKQVAAMMITENDLREKLAFSNNQRKSMDPWGFRKEAELGYNRFDTRLRIPMVEEPKRKKKTGTGSDMAKHFQTINQNKNDSPLGKQNSDDDEYAQDFEIQPNNNNDDEETYNPVISSHIDDLMLGSVPSRHFTGAKNMFAKDDGTQRFLSPDSSAPTTPNVPDIKEGKQKSQIMSIEYGNEEEDDYGHDNEFEGDIHRTQSNVTPASHELSKSQPVPVLVPCSPIDHDRGAATMSPPITDVTHKKKRKDKKGGAHSARDKKELNPIIQKNKRLAASGGVLAAAKSSKAKNPVKKSIPVIKRVNNYVEVLPVVKKFGAYGCLDSTKNVVELHKLSPGSSLIPSEGRITRRGTKEMDSNWLEEGSMMDSVRLGSQESFHTKDTFTTKPDGLW